MRRRKKQFLYGVGYLLFLIGIFALVYLFFIKSAPSCSDGIKNQGEEEVDCGLVCGNNCAILSVRPVEITSVEFITVRNQSIAVIEIRNPNSLFGALGVDYSLTLQNELGQQMRIEDSTFIYPGEIRYRILINVPKSDDKLNFLPYELAESGVDWVEANGFLRPNNQIRDVQIEYDSSQRLMMVRGILKNANDFAISRALINAIVRNQEGGLVGASKTLVKDLSSQEERYFQVVVPIIAGALEEDIAPAKITVEMVR